MGMEPRHKMIDFQSEEGVLFIYMGGGGKNEVHGIDYVNLE